MEEHNVIRTREDEDRFFWDKPYFAFIDILGFRELVKNNSHAEVVDLYKNLVKFPVTSYEAYHKQAQAIRKEELGEYYHPTDLRLVNISDSIMLWTANSRESSLYALLSGVKMLMSISMSVGVPLRGSIVKGDIEVMEQSGSLSIVGRGLVHAYETESRQDWSGCTIDAGIINYLRSYHEVVKGNKGPIPIDRMDYLAVETDIPFKSGPKKGYVVNWAHNTDLTEAEIQDSFSKFNKRQNESPDVKAATELKIENTLKFYKEFGGKKS